MYTDESNALKFTLKCTRRCDPRDLQDFAEFSASRAYLPILVNSIYVQLQWKQCFRQRISIEYKNRIESQRRRMSTTITAMYLYTDTE